MGRTRFVHRPLALGVCFIAWAGIAPSPSPALDGSPEHHPGRSAREHALPLPSGLSLEEFERRLHPWILARSYATELAWCIDKGVRDTGPWVKGRYYGTHPAVRVFYSPKMMYWLTGDPGFWPEGVASGEAVPKEPRGGEVPDGAMIVKEMFDPPAARYEDLAEEELVKALLGASSPGWTVMVKDRSGSRDGWFWASVWPGVPIDTPDSLALPASGFGMPCLRCHAVAERESTFSTPRNIAGFPGDPVTFFSDDTWRDLPAEEMPYDFTHGPPPRPKRAASAEAPRVGDPEFLRVFPALESGPVESVKRFPSESNDHVVARADGTAAFLTSDQCMMCHGGASSAYGYGPIQFLETETGGKNVSPYGEWRWSPMGLAGRDPVFHAQIESEISILEREFPAEKAELLAEQTVNTCLLCHGALGKRQWDHDRGAGNSFWEKPGFELSWFSIADASHERAKYAALGRDGISCLVCHSMMQEHVDIRDYLNHSTTGQFTLAPRKEAFGPFEDAVISPLAMENALGLTPRHDPYIQSSRLCGTCHTINLPVVDWPLADPPECETPSPTEIDELLAAVRNPEMKPFRHRIEQATYLEWLNSSYQDEFSPKSESTRSCQDCQMPTGYHDADGSVSVEEIRTKIAVIEDHEYPEADHRAPTEAIRVRFREKGYRRHTLQGLNIFLAEMFRQFNDVLGVRLQDYETGEFGLNFAIENYVQNARENTARVRIEHFRAAEGTVEADVRVTNLTGHRLPSGVGFRRVFLELLVLDAGGDAPRVIWGSGRTNGVGVLVDGEGRILPSEFFTEHERDGVVQEQYQPHRQIISEQDEVQVYEELTKDAKGRFTTSFLHRACEVKDNRLLPKGWTPEGPSEAIPEAFIRATHPGEDTHGDPDYADGSGSDVVRYRVRLPPDVDPKSIQVRATLYSQSWAPYYLRQRFTDVPAGPKGDARRRLHFLASHLDLEGTAIEGWKLFIASDSTPR